MTGSREIALVPLGDSGWRMWSECELRSAGLPAAAAQVLFDDELEEDAHRAQAPDAQFLAAYAKAQERLSGAISRACADGLFTEMIAWQNPEFVRDCVSATISDRPARPAVRRRRELKIASYLQRYALKNDTIGFFGPVCWARVTDGPRAIELRCGNSLLAARRVYFEYWALDAIAQALAADGAVRQWLKPRASVADVLVGDVVHRPYSAPVSLTAAQARVYRLCDGTRPVLALAAEGQAELGRLCDAGLVSLGFDVPIGVDSEQSLRRQVRSIGDAAARARTLATLDELSAARDAVSRAAGDTSALLVALNRLDETFGRTSGQDANHRRGETYAGRKIVYEDTRRDTEVRLGRPLLDALAAPLGLVLDSASWFTGYLAQAYLKRFDEIYERCKVRGVGAEVSFASLLSSATPDLAFSYSELSPLVAAAVPELQRRWARALRLPSGVRRHAVRSDEIADEVRRLFPRMAPRWSSAIYQCPDVMVAAPSAAAVNQGEFTLVLGELHLATNTLDCTTLDLHADPDAIWAADQRDRGGGRILPVPAKAAAEVNTRTYPPTIRSAQYTYWAMHADSTGAPGQILPGASLTVHRADDRLVVRTPRDGEAIDLLEMLGEYLSAAVMNAFQPVGMTTPERAPGPKAEPAGHRPRVMIDRLVIARESWSFAPASMAWPFVKDPAGRYHAAQSWRRAHRLPRRAFYRVVVETKPLFIDFSSIALVNLLAGAVRHAAEEDAAAPVRFTEMLPDLTSNWLTDSAGAAYTSELRFVLVDGNRGAR